MTYTEIIKKLKAEANENNRLGMIRFGISPKGTLGVSTLVLRRMQKEIGKDQALSLRLWDSGIHEARILAAFIGEKEKVTETQMEKWVKGVDSWDVCDQLCGNLFDKTSFAYKKVYEWVEREEEFVRRVGFVLMSTLSVHDKEAKDKEFEKFFPLIKKHSIDERNFVKKAVNWALRQIGKRNLALNKKAIKLAKEINDKNAIRELTSEAVQRRLKK